MSMLGSLALLPPDVLSSGAFRVLAAFVAINTVMYAAVTVAKVLPKASLAAVRRRAYERSETRSIYPGAPR